MITPIKTETKFVDLHQIRQPKTGTWTCTNCDAARSAMEVLHDPYDPNEERKLTVPTETIRNTSLEGEIIRINEVRAKSYKWMDVLNIDTYNDNPNMGLETSWRTDFTDVPVLLPHYSQVMLFFRRGPALTFTPTRTTQEMLLQIESYIADGSLLELGTILSAPSIVRPTEMSEVYANTSSSLLNSVPYYLSPGDAIYGFLKPYSSSVPFIHPSQAVCSLKINMQTYKNITIN
jgi:hypothetical protein